MNLSFSEDQCTTPLSLVRAALGLVAPFCLREKATVFTFAGSNRPDCEHDLSARISVWLWAKMRVQKSSAIVAPRIKDIPQYRVNARRPERRIQHGAFQRMAERFRELLSGERVLSI